VYKNYILNIRKEYSQIATTQFTLGRKGFIQHLLSQQHIFYTQQFREKEEQARKNMQWELEMSPGIFSAG
jgi:predicted metal-dependent HD superfamily phosphohydrolase